MANTLETRAAPDNLGAKDRVIVTDEALSTIIGLAAHEVPGVVGMSPANFREGVRRILGAQQVDEGVEIARGEETIVTLYLVVAYGVNIPAVAESVRERVFYAAGTFAGVEVSRVQIHIVGVGRGER